MQLLKYFVDLADGELDFYFRQKSYHYLFIYWFFTAQVSILLQLYNLENLNNLILRVISVMLQKLEH